MITSEQLIDAFDAAGVGESALTIMDSQYSLPSFDWVANEFADSLRENLNATSSWYYIKERNDCNQFALQAWSLARLAHVNSTSNKSGLAFGMFIYTQENKATHHALNVFLHRNNNNEIKLGFFEPQTQKIAHLTDMEIAFGLVLI